MLRCILLLATAVVACGPTPGVTDSDTTDTPDTTGSTTGTTTGTTTDEPTTGATTTSTGTTTTSTSTTSTSTTSTTTTTTDTTGTTGGEVCEAPDDGVVAGWSINMPNGEQETTISASCEVVILEEMGPKGVLTLICKLDAELVVELFVTREPIAALPFQVGDIVEFEYRQEQIFWINQWFSLRDADNPTVMVLAGISGDKVAPPDTSAQDFYSVDIAVVPGLCPPGDASPCDLGDRLALDITFVGTPGRVFDRQFSTLTDLSGEFRIWLERAARPVEADLCDDVPPAWFQALMTQGFGP